MRFISSSYKNIGPSKLNILELIYETSVFKSKERERNSKRELYTYANGNNNEHYNKIKERGDSDERPQQGGGQRNTAMKDQDDDAYGSMDDVLNDVLEVSDSSISRYARSGEAYDSIIYIYIYIYMCVCVCLYVSCIYLSISF